MLSMLKAKKYGAGPRSVIVLHDWVGTHENYQWCEPLWDTKQYTFHFLDLRGYGLSKDLGGTYTQEEIASDVQSYIESHHLQGAALVAHSMTGLATVTLWNDKLLSGAFLATPVSPHGAPISDEALYTGMLDQLSSQEGREGILQFQYGGFLSQGWIQHKLDRWWKETNVEAVKGYFKMFARHSDPQVDVNIPIHVFVGGKDHPPFDEQSLRQAFSSYPKVTWTVHPLCSHAPMEEAPAYFVNSVELFLSAIFS